MGGECNGKRGIIKPIFWMTYYVFITCNIIKTSTPHSHFNTIVSRLFPQECSKMASQLPQRYIICLLASQDHQFSASKDHPWRAT